MPITYPGAAPAELHQLDHPADSQVDAVRCCTGFSTRRGGVAVRHPIKEE